MPPDWKSPECPVSYYGQMQTCISLKGFDFDELDNEDSDYILSIGGYLVL